MELTHTWTQRVDETPYHDSGQSAPQVGQEPRYPLYLAT